MKLYTIGVSQIPAEMFFSLLKEHGVQRIVDVRLRPDGQLSGFAKRRDLQFFLRELASCHYTHLPILAPTAAILDDYRKGGNWERFVEQFEVLMSERDIPQSLDCELFEREVCCLLCTEPDPKQCHRRLVAERLAKVWGDVEIIHLRAGRQSPCDGRQGRG